jgi:hypothetical protein
MIRLNLERVRTFWPEVFALATIIGFYGYHLCPSTFWSDSAAFQAQAYTLNLGSAAHDHLLYQIINHILVTVFSGTDPALVLNIFSLVAAVLTLCLLHQTLYCLQISRTGRIFTTLLFAVTHTFWRHAVITEVYALTLLLESVAIYFMVRDAVRPVGKQPYFLSLFLSAGCLVHIMQVLLFPGYLVCLRLVRHSSYRQMIYHLLWLGAGPAILVAVALIGGFNSVSAVFFGTPVWHAEIVHLYWLQLGGDLLHAGVYLLYNFTFAAGLVVWGFSRTLRQRRWVPFTIIGATIFLFAFRYHVSDQYVFYLPFYYICALWLACGWEAMAARWRKVRWLLPTAGLIIAVHLAVYTTVPVLLAHSTHPQARAMEYKSAYKGGWRYYLFPGLHHYQAPRVVLEKIIFIVPSGALVLLSWDFYSIYQYFAARHAAPENITFYFFTDDFVRALEKTGQKGYVFSSVLSREEKNLLSGRDVRIMDLNEFYR